jgi:hypothetical protein
MSSSSQRAMAEHHEFSLGKMDFILKVLIVMGFMKLISFSRNQNKIGNKYVLTHDGLTDEYNLE